jgi:hypothetical protein
MHEYISLAFSLISLSLLKGLYIDLPAMGLKRNEAKQSESKAKAKRKQSESQAKAKRKQSEHTHIRFSLCSQNLIDEARSLVAMPGKSSPL